MGVRKSSLRRFAKFNLSALCVQGLQMSWHLELLD